VQNINSQDFEQQNQAKMDESLLVRFFTQPIQSPSQTAKEGRPIFVDTCLLEVRTPGSRDAIVRPASQRDIARFPRHYEAFKNRVEGEVNDGTPLAEWPLISRSMVEELAFFSVKTVEQLISMSDQHASKFMGINTLKTKAKAWLEVANEDAKATELAAEVQKRDDEIAELRAAIKELQAAPKPARRVAKKKASRKKVSAQKE
jgi:hypothetical protein